MYNVFLYIYIVSAVTISYRDVFLNMAIQTDVLHITGLEPGKIASGMKLTQHHLDDI